MTSHSSALDRGFSALLHLVQQELIIPQQRRELWIPEHLRQLTGGSDGNALTLTTERYQGGWFDVLTLATLTTSAGQLCSLTVVGLPFRHSGHPILGIDLIALRGALSLIAVDLAPTDDAAWESHCAPLLADLIQSLDGVITHRKRPDFTEGVFSPLALIAGAHAGKESQIFSVLSGFLRKVAALPTEMGITDPALVHPDRPDRRERWLAAERRNRKEHNALARLFGAALATEYLDGFLFASLTPDAASHPQSVVSEAASVHPR